MRQGHTENKEDFTRHFIQVRTVMGNSEKKMIL